VLGDVAQLWATFARFAPAQLVGMAADMSHRYYYRLSDPADEVFSRGWANVPQRTGVNGGLMLLHLARMRAVRFSAQLIDATRRGSQLREMGELAGFCRLAEQDTINWLLAQQPALWHPIDCRWNYMGTVTGGHALRVVALPLAARGGELHAYYDDCPHGGPTGANGAPGDLLRCECGARVEVLHFAGGTRASSVRRELNASIVDGAPEALLHDARVRRSLPTSFDALLAAHKVSVEAATAGSARDGESETRSSSGLERTAGAEGECTESGDDRPAEPCVRDGSCPDPYSSSGTQ